MKVRSLTNTCCYASLSGVGVTWRHVPGYIPNFSSGAFSNLTAYVTVNVC